MLLDTPSRQVITPDVIIPLYCLRLCLFYIVPCAMRELVNIPAQRPRWHRSLPSAGVRGIDSTREEPRV